MKNLSLKLRSLNAVLGTVRGQKTVNLSESALIDEKSSILSLLGYLSMLLLTLPVITTILMLWFRIK